MRLKPEQEKLVYIFNIILDNIDEGVNVVDEDGRLIYVNRASAEYVNSTTDIMMGRHICEFYPYAALLDVLETRESQLNKRIDHRNGKKFMVNAIPLVINNEFKGGIAVFRNITELEVLSSKIEVLENKIRMEKGIDPFSIIIGRHSSIAKVVAKAQKAIGSLAGPRHSIISGESGTGKTLLANAMYSYAKIIGVLKNDAPFIEINCAEFVNSDIAAVEIFGSEKGAFTGSQGKKGLFELADGGMLFLDEAHALEHYQTILLKAIESGRIKRIGGIRNIKSNVIIIAASTKDLKKVFLPELYQRLAQYELKLPPLRDRPITEKKQLLNFFIKNYEKNVLDRYKIKLNVSFTRDAEEMLLSAVYPRNIRQLRDVINSSIDAAAPQINDISSAGSIDAIVDVSHIPSDILEPHTAHGQDPVICGNKPVLNMDGISFDLIDQELIHNSIIELNEKGLGPRRIAKELKKKGIDIEYYQIAYRLKKIRSES